LRRGSDGKTTAQITVEGGGETFVVQLTVEKPDTAKIFGFVEIDGHVSIKAPHFSRAVASGEIAVSKSEDVRWFLSLRIEPLHLTSEGGGPVAISCWDNEHHGIREGVASTDGQALHVTFGTRSLEFTG
jgi:hypothetical protein